MKGAQKVTELQKTLDKAYRLASAIQVSGDSVDLMAAVRECIRHAFKMSEPTSGKDGD